MVEVWGRTERHARDWLRIKRGGSRKGARSRWEWDQRGISWLGNLEQLRRADMSSRMWRMGYNTQEQKNSGTDNTRKEQVFATFFVWFLGLF